MKHLLGTSLFRKGILFLNARDSISPFLEVSYNINDRHIQEYIL